jgi:hypothetical protein
MKKYQEKIKKVKKNGTQTKNRRKTDAKEQVSAR